MSTAIAISSEEALLRSRVSKNITDLDARRKLARIYAATGKSREAAGLYAQVLKAERHDTEALTQLAYFYLELGDLGPASVLFHTLLAVNPGNCGAQYQLMALQALKEKGRAVEKFTKLYERIVHERDESVSLGLEREQIPCLIEMNGDPLWIPGDLLRFLWHTVQKPLGSFMPSFLAETGHYLWVRERISPGDDVLDIGSNLGIFATMMGARVGKSGRVFAFEPSSRIASDLRRVLALNELSQVTVVEAAASNRNGKATFCEIAEGDVRRESSHLSDPVLDQSFRELKQNAISVRTLVVDDFVEEHKIRPTLIKIDVEGAEFLVLEGARQTIGAHKPKLVIEFHANSEGVFDHARLTGYLKRLGYEFKTEDKTYYAWSS